MVHPQIEPGAALGDMPTDELRRHARRLADRVADYLETVEEHPVLARVQPGETAAALPLEAPETGVPMEQILAEFDRDLLRGVTHWNHPAFFAYFAISGSGPGILGELLAAALNVNAMLWRTAPAATELELRTLDWLRQMLGLPDGFHGVIQDTASLSTLTALAAARESLGLPVREQGLSGLPPLRLYCSEEAHSSVAKAALVLGIGRAGTCSVATDEKLSLRPVTLEAAIAADRAAGRVPFCVVATVGTTSTTAIDPVPEIARLCRRERLWLHVDAAYGGSAAVAEEFRHVLDGCGDADSLVVNPHKWLFVPVDCSALFFRDPDVVRRSLSLVPDYLVTPEHERVTNLMEYGPALGRRFRALKLWMTLRYFGRIGLAERIREHVRLARLFASWVDERRDWERLAEVPFSVVVFRYRPAGTSDTEADALNERILETVNRGGDAFLSHTRVRKRFALRLAIGNLRTREAHVRRAWERLCEAAEAIRHPSGSWGPG